MKRATAPAADGFTLRRRAVLALAAGGLAWPTQAEDAVALRPWPKGRATPALELPEHQGARFSLAAKRGQVVVLNFWASWCAPCRSEMPSLELLAERHAGDRLLVVAVNFRETDAAVRRFLAETGTTLPILRDVDGGAAKAFGVRVFPSTVVVARDGRAAFTVLGEADWSGAAARRWIGPLL